MNGQIEGPLAPRAFQARAQLRFAHFVAFTQRRFDARADVAARAFELARRGGLVFAEQASDFGERAIVRVVIGEAQAVPRVERA